jgi:hypothetical protein
MTEASKYSFPKAEKVQVFEQVDTYIETQHNYATDPSVQATIADLQTLIIQLQTQHPNIATEPKALAIIDVELIEIQQSPTHKLATLRQQLLNPERHLQSTKATLGEIIKHYLEESVWAKAVITHLDILSETPDRGG